MIVVVPCVSVWARPCEPVMLEMDATDVLDETQVTSFVKICRRAVGEGAGRRELLREALGDRWIGGRHRNRSQRGGPHSP